MKKLALLLLGFAVAGLAHADPVTIGTILTTSIIEIGTATILTVGQAIFMVGAIIYGSAAQRRAAREAKNAYNASLEDKQATSVGQDLAIRYVYGQDRVGANVVAMFTSGGKDEFRHLVCVVANHEVQSIDEVYLNGKAVGTPDATTGIPAVGTSTETLLLYGDNNVDGHFYNTSLLPKTFTSLVLKATNDQGVTWTTLVQNTHYTITLGATAFFNTLYNQNGYITLNSPYNTSSYQIQLSYHPNYWIKDPNMQSFGGLINSPLTLPTDYSDLYVYLNNITTNENTPQAYTITSGVLTPAAYPAWVEYKYLSQSSSTVKLFKHLGTPTEAADTYLMGQVSGKWTSNHVLRGHAYIVLTLDLNENEFQSGPPRIEALVTGKKVYDPRADSTISGGSGSQRYNDSTTWTWSSNPALCILDYITSPMVGIAKSDLTGVFSFYQTAANVCDESITINGASVAKYTMNGVVTAEEDGFSVLSAMADSMAGIVNGVDWSCYAGKYITPVVTLNHIDDVVGNLAITAGASKSDIYNTVKGRFTGPEHNYAPSDFPPYIDSTYKTADGEELTHNVEFKFTNNIQRIYNLASIQMKDIRNGMTITGDFSYKAWRLRPGDRVYFNSPPYTGVAVPVLLGMNAKVFRITDRSFRIGEPVKLTMKEDDSSIWATGPTATAKALVNTCLLDPYQIPRVSNFTASSGDTELIKDSSGSIVTRIHFTWDRTTYLSAVTAELQYRKHGETAWNTINLTNYEMSTYAVGVSDGETYTARIRYVNVFLGAEGDWTYLDHTVVGKTAPPPAFDTFTVLAQPDGTRQFNFAYTVTSAPVDWAGAEIRYVSGSVGSPTWATMTRLQDQQTFYTASPVETNYPVSGTWTFACCSIDTTGNYSTMKVVTIDLPDRRVGDAFYDYSEIENNWPGTVTNLVKLGGTFGLEATDSTQWSSEPSWSSFTQWNAGTTTSATYVSSVLDLGVKISGLLNYEITATGGYTLDYKSSDDNITWSSYTSISNPFNARYLQVRTSLTGGGGTVISVTALKYTATTDVKTEYINDVNISTLTGSYRIGTGDVRAPITGTYVYIKRVSVTIQDSSAGTWSFQCIDKNTSPGPRFQFKLNGTLTDPALVDFFIEGV